MSNQRKSNTQSRSSAPQKMRSGSAQERKQAASDLGQRNKSHSESSSGSR